MKIVSLLGLVLFYFCLLLSSALTVSPINSPIFDQSRGGVVTILSNSYSAGNSFNVNTTYSRAFPTGLSYNPAIGVSDVFHSHTATMFPLTFSVTYTTVNETYIIFSVYVADTLLSRLKISYIVVNNAYTSSSFNVVPCTFGSYYFNISSYAPVTYPSINFLTINTTGGWNAALFCNKLMTRYRTYNTPLDGFSFRIRAVTNATNVVSFIASSYNVYNT